MLYKIAHRVWNITKWIWSTIIIVFVVGVVTNLVVAPDPEKTILASFIEWLILLGPLQWLALSIFILFLAITLFAWIFVTIEKYGKDGNALQRYLRSVVNDNMRLSPTGIYQQSQALISVNVPLDDNFIHLLTVSNRPRHDIPAEQQRRLEELRQRSDMSIEEREAHEEEIQRLKSIWRYTLHEQAPVTIGEMLRQLTPTNPVIVILGAPGSGKSTSLRWLALHMARASLSTKYSLPDGLTIRQVPVLLSISEYAKKLEASADLSFDQFLNEHLSKKHQELSTKVKEELARGRGLLLFDGLDEVASDDLRRRVAKAIQAFIATHTSDNAQAKDYNRFVVTSRIVGYEEGPFSRYTHSTLLELSDKQIEQFLTTWCPAVERHMIRSTGRTRELIAQQQSIADQAAAIQRNRLLDTIKTHHGIRRLAINPLMLTILALIQRSGKTLPHRRIDLYRVITRTLIDNWNQGSGRESLDVRLTEQTLSNLAYRLHESGRLIIARDVKEIVRKSMTDFYERPLDKNDEDTVDKFIETIRRTSGLFVETGQGLFSFMHRTFQEYYAAQYLLSKPLSELKQFVAVHYSIAAWHEPLLLAIADKSGQDRQETSAIIQVIMDTNNDHDTFLHRHLLFVVSSMVDCDVWSISTSLQKNIAKQLFNLYGDTYGAGRYMQLQTDIEKATLLWLSRQVSNSWTPLLEAWHEALCDATQSICQEGATHLLASLAPELPHCPPLVLSLLIPRLMKLAGLQDLPCPPEVRTQLSQLTAHPSSQQVEDYAFVALHLLEASGPAGWLHQAWLAWDKDQPELLERLTQHSLELDHLLTPAALPSDDPNWEEQSDISKDWQKQAKRDPHNLQKQLLDASEAARYPQAYLFREMLKQEEGERTKGITWRASWDLWLQKEMTRGCSATYQACLNLRLLLCKGDKQRQQEIANELIASLSEHGQQQVHILAAITNIYLRELRDLKHLKDMRYLRYMIDLRDVRELRYLRELRELRYMVDLIYMKYLRELRDMIDMVDMKYLIRLRNISNM